MPAAEPSMRAPIEDNLDLMEPSPKLIKPKHSSSKGITNSLNRSLILDDSHERARDNLGASNQSLCFTPRVSNRPLTKRVRGGNVHINIFSRDINSLVGNSLKDWNKPQVKDSFSISRDPSPVLGTIKSSLHEDLKLED